LKQSQSYTIGNQIPRIELGKSLNNVWVSVRCTHNNVHKMANSNGRIVMQCERKTKQKAIVVYDKCF
jgi:N-acetylmuramic acid 6-phosphate (MurNAc-6-P) etherase